MPYILASNACSNFLQPETCCTLYTPAFQITQHTTQTHATSNRYKFVYTYPEQVKQSALERSKKLTVKLAFKLSASLKCSKNVIKIDGTPNKPKRCFCDKC